MTDKDLRDIEGRCLAATPGPWEYHIGSTRLVVAGNATTAIVGAKGIGVALVGHTEHHAGQKRSPGGHTVDCDADFIAGARTDVLALVAEVKRLRMLAATRG